ncbi:hypothetical protein [Hoeflea marina]|nr:hypothetical protein [Hoeflea marina]
MVDPGRALHRIAFHVGDIPAEMTDFARRNGIELVQVPPFGLAASPYCNKLGQLSHLARSGADYLIMSDIDIAFMASPAGLIEAGKIRAKIVDQPNPPGDRLRELLSEMGFPDATLDRCPDFAPGHPTHRYNCNGGLYVLPRTCLDLVGERWIDWTMQCSRKIGLLRDAAIHIDQLGFMLAMIELDLPFEPLATEDNFPTHFEPEAYARWRPAEIRALHYHHRIDVDGRLQPTGATAVDIWVDRANQALAISRDEYARFDPVLCD